MLPSTLSCRRLVFVILLAVAMPLAARQALAQSEAEQVGPVLGEEIISPSVSLYQLKQYLLKHIAKPPSPASASQWTKDAKQLRERLLAVVFHGWPKEWVTAPPKFEDLGLVESGKGYRTRKLRYEIVPGFQSAAILYEPENLTNKVPAILNVNGHVGAPGKSVEYKQKRCINFAKRGIMALNLEWLSFGELSGKENEHWFGAHLDLVGTHEQGLFMLAMRKGLDYLYEHPKVDRSRLGVTGLSGGGWQTITLSSLDERVTAAAPVAGFSSLIQRIEARWFGDLGDVEQAGTDLFDGQDYTHLEALVAPRAMLLTYNAEDDCCFRAPMVKPLTLDALKPLYRLYGKEEALEWHENRDPGTHNYQLDNRLQAYRFFSKQFTLPLIENEIPSDAEVKSYEELVVGLPSDNLTILGLARKLGASISRPPVPEESSARKNWADERRSNLKNLVRYKPVQVERVWTVANTKNKGVETKSYLFSMSNGLSANAVWLKAIASPDNAPVTLILHDQGKKAAGVEVSDRVNRGEQVLATDLLFTGDAWAKLDSADYQQILHGIGDRPIGMEAAQLIEAAHWIKERTGVSQLRLESTGIRNQVVALIAAALQPELFSEVVVREGMGSLAYLLEKPVEFSQAADLFCLDLYKEFDLDRLESVALPTRFVHGPYLTTEVKGH
jgi:dienelactone hydrolase